MSVMDTGDHDYACDARREMVDDEQSSRLASPQFPDAPTASVQSVIIYEILFDEKETLVYISPSVEAVLGHSPEAFIADQGLWSRCIHPDDQDRVRADISRTGVSTDQYVSTYRMLTSDHSVVNVHDSAVLVHDLGSKPLCWQGVVAIASNDHFQHLLKHSGDLVSIISVDGTVDYLSPALKHVLGYGKGGAQQDKGFAFVHPEDETSARAAWTALILKPEIVITLEIRVRNADESWRWMEGTGTNRLHDLEVGGLVIRWRDVTELRAGRAALDLVNRAIAVTSNGIVITDMRHPSQPIVEVNPAFERMTGYDRAELLGQNCRFLQGFATARLSVDSIRAGLAAGREVRETLLNYRKDGSPFWNELHLAPVVNLDSAVTHYVGILNDVTDQRLAEEELRVQGQLLEQAKVAVMAFQIDGQVTHWNRHAEYLYGWPEQEAVGQSIFDLTVEPTNHKVGRAIFAVLRAGESWEGEILCKRKDGTAVEVHVVMSPVFHAEGHVQRVVCVSHDITARKAFDAHLLYQASHDQLTGLLNHVHFSKHLERALRRSAQHRKSVALLYLDIDRFKLINDGLGHAAGDKFLAEMGRRLTKSMRATDRAARLGGDEFAILLDPATVKTARATADRVQAAIAEQLTLEGRELYPSASIGLVVTPIGLVVTPPNHFRPDEVLRAGDVALYQAKRAGGGTYVIFDSSTADLTSGWLKLEADLRKAIKLQELWIAYQPIISLKDGRTGAVEALLRWNHPQRGLVPPREFVPVAEETGLITVITDWILQEACLQLATWRKDLGNRAPLSVNVNLTTRTLRDPGLVDRIMGAITSADLPLHCLRLEITEQVLIEVLRAAAPTLRKLHDRGISLAIDDFGAGASSLASLRTVDIEVLKLDRSFADFLPQSDNQIVIEAVTTMAHALSVEVAVEGIERREQLRLAQVAGCDWGQGYLLARPASARDLTPILATAPWMAFI